MDIQFLKSTLLFQGMDEAEIKAAMSSLAAREKRYKKGSFVMNAGRPAESLGLVLEGSVTIESNDFWGKRTLLSSVGKGQLFAESYAILEDEPLLVDVAANENCRILFLSIAGVRRLNCNAESWKSKFILNLLRVSAQKNLLLSGRSFHISPKTIRARVMAYLNSVALQKNSREFDIPFDRQQLADYLNLERTALSKELGKMQREGMISARKKHFMIQAEREEF